MIDEGDLAALTETDTLLALPAGWRRTAMKEPMPDVIAAIRASRAAR